MSKLLLPPDIEAVFREFRTCEFTTLAKDGTPITWPTLPFYFADEGRFIITTSIGLPHKAFNVRRDPRVSLLFSESTASGLTKPPAVLVQGDAVAPDEILTSIKGVEALLKQSFERQPSSTIYSSNPLMRYLFDWYYMRLTIVVTPRRILYWPERDFSKPAHTLEVAHVG